LNHHVGGDDGVVGCVGMDFEAGHDIYGVSLNTNNVRMIILRTTLVFCFVIFTISLLAQFFANIYYRYDYHTLHRSWCCLAGCPLRLDSICCMTPRLDK